MTETSGRLFIIILCGISNINLITLLLYCPLIQSADACFGVCSREIHVQNFIAHEFHLPFPRSAIGSHPTKQLPNPYIKFACHLGSTDKTQANKTDDFNTHIYKCFPQK
jgi:hypothetical protein